MVRDAEANAAEDKLKKDRIEASNQVRLSLLFKTSLIMEHLASNSKLVPPRHVNSKVALINGNLGPKSWKSNLKLSEKSEVAFLSPSFRHDF